MAHNKLAGGGGEHDFAKIFLILSGHFTHFDQVNTFHQDQCTSVCDVRQCDGACTTGREEGSVWYGCQGTCGDNPCYENEVLIQFLTSKYT